LRIVVLLSCWNGFNAGKLLICGRTWYMSSNFIYSEIAHYTKLTCIAIWIVRCVGAPCLKCTATTMGPYPNPVSNKSTLIAELHG
jgi:hypothetical protein